MKSFKRFYMCVIITSCIMFSANVFAMGYLPISTTPKKPVDENTGNIPKKPVDENTGNIPENIEYIPGQSYYGSAGDEENGKYIEYIPGNLPIILSSAHGGYLKPEAVKTRRYGSSDTDTYTQEMTRQIMEDIYNETGGYPHVIINLLHRKKLDGNRDIGEAAQGDPLSKEAWYNFHAFIDYAKKQAVSQYDHGLYIDVHGFPGWSNKVIIGYRLTGANLRRSDDEINDEKYINKSTIKNLYQDNIQDLSFAEILRGNMSIGGLFDRLDNPIYESVPSPSKPYPKSGETYYGGVYNMKRHCIGKGNEKISGFQLELDKKIRTLETEGEQNKGEIARQNFSRALKDILIKFFKIHHDIDLATCYK